MCRPHYAPKTSKYVKNLEIMKIFPPLKLLYYSWPRCGSLTFVAINRITGYQFWLLCIRCMWFQYRIGQNGIGKNTLKLYRSYHYFIQGCIYMSGNRTHDPWISTPVLYRLSNQGNLVIQSVWIAISSSIIDTSVNPICFFLWYIGPQDRFSQKCLNGHTFFLF